MKTVKTLANMLTDARYENVLEELGRLTKVEGVALVDPEEMLLEILQMKRRLDHLQEHIPADFEITTSEEERCTKCLGSGDYCYNGDGHHYGEYRTCEVCRGKGFVIKVVSLFKVEKEG